MAVTGHRSTSMGRARRLHRSRQGDGWKTPLRFAVGTEVMCMYNERWARGRVVAHHYEEPKGVFYPYQIRLETPEVLIYAPADEDDCIQKAVSFRFEIGALVECNLGDADGPDWETGHVVAYNFQQPKGVFNPYQIKLLNGALIYAPADEDTLIKKAEIPVASPCPDEGNRACSGNMTIVSKDPVTPDGINANQHTTKKRATAPSCTFAFENPGADDCGYLSHGHRDLVKNVLSFWRSMTGFHLKKQEEKKIIHDCKQLDTIDLTNQASSESRNCPLVVAAIGRDAQDAATRTSHARGNRMGQRKRRTHE